jgi:hypothetical protein
MGDWCSDYEDWLLEPFIGYLSHSSIVSRYYLFTKNKNVYWSGHILFFIAFAADFHVHEAGTVIVMESNLMEQLLYCSNERSSFRPIKTLG